MLGVFITGHFQKLLLNELKLVKGETMIHEQLNKYCLSSESNYYTIILITII